MFEFYPVGNPILLAHIWILHKILDRIAPKLESFKKNCLKLKYPNRVGSIYIKFPLSFKYKREFYFEKWGILQKYLK